MADEGVQLNSHTDEVGQNHVAKRVSLERWLPQHDLLNHRNENGSGFGNQASVKAEAPHDLYLKDRMRKLCGPVSRQLVFMVKILPSHLNLPEQNKH